MTISNSDKTRTTVLDDAALGGVSGGLELPIAPVGGTESGVPFIPGILPVGTVNPLEPLVADETGNGHVGG